MGVPGFDELLRHLAEVPRENGTAALQESVAFVASALRQAGLEVRTVAFLGQPWAGRIAGVVVLVGSLLYTRWMLGGRPRRAYWLSIVYSTLLLLQFGYSWPVVGWIAPRWQSNIEARLPAVRPTQRLLLTAHLDSVTEVLDHVQTGRVDWLHMVTPFAVIPAAAIVAAGAVGPPRGWRRGLAIVASLVAVVQGASAFAEISAGALLHDRSDGAVDDGASCAVLVQAAAALARGPRLAHTDVEIVLFSSEEVAIQGSAAYVRERFPRGAPEPTAVVNLEGLGQSAHLGVLSAEPYGLGAFPPDRRLVDLLGRVYERTRGETLALLPYHARTDARAFLAHGIPALTLVSYVPDRTTRGLHTAGDTRARLEESTLPAAVEFLVDVARAVDGEEL